jgi:hypothetical protein
MADAPDAAKRRLREAKDRIGDAVDSFRKAAQAAVDVAADPKASDAAAAEARMKATFALAAVGLAFKAALREARPADASP